MLLPQVLQAQQIDFLPPGAFSLGFYQENTSYDSVTRTRTQEKSLLDQRLDQHHVAKNRISGSLSESQSSSTLQLQWGFAENWNLQLAQPQVTRSRQANLSLDRPNAKAETFMEHFGDQSRSGLGDATLNLIWRFAYTDFNDLRTYFGLGLGNGDTYWDEPDRLSLGNGGKDGWFRFHWTHHFSDNQTSFHSQYWRSFPGLSEFSQGSRDIGVAPGSRQGLLFGYDSLWSYGVWGLGLEGIERQMTTIGRERFFDDGNQLGYFFKLGLGNLAALERPPRPALPWDLELKYSRIFFGINAPQETSLGLNLSLYF